MALVFRYFPLSRGKQKQGWRRRRRKIEDDARRSFPVNVGSTWPRRGAAGPRSLETQSQRPKSGLQEPRVQVHQAEPTEVEIQEEEGCSTE